jgi:Flp pilus assembly protein TadD
MFGFAMALVYLLTLLPSRRLLPAVLAVVLLLYAGAGWQRNAVWSNDIAFALDGVKKAPHNQRTYLTLATAYAGENRWPEAEATLRRAIPLRPNHHIPYDNLGTALFQQGRLAEARNYFKFASLLMPDYPNAIFNYGIASLRLGDMQEAVNSLNRLRQLRSPLAFRLGAEFTGNR